MNSRDLDAAMVAANPIAPGAVASLPLPAIEAEIIGQDPEPASAPPSRPVLRRPNRRPALALAAGAAIVLAVALVLSLGGASRQPEFAQGAVAVAEANPRLLVTAPGWSVIDAGEFEPDSGEVRFGDGERQLSINWYPAGMYKEFLQDRAEVSAPETAPLLGRTATTISYSPDEHATILAPQGPVFVETRGKLGSLDAYREVLDSLQAVDVQTWLSAMPANVVRPADRADEVQRLLKGVPLPPGFDTAALAGEEVVLNDYQFAVKVADEVSCSWVKSWLAATSAGDAARATAAATAMSTYSRWPMMKTLEEGGGWAANIKASARELRSGNVRRGPAGYSVEPDGSGYAFGPSWAVHLNCTSEYWKRPLSPAEVDGL